jgi:hypothetical protein
MNVHPDYTAAWRDYRKRSFIFWTVFLGYIPGVLVLFVGAGLPIAALTGTKPDYFFYPIAGSWMLAFLITSWQVVLFRCPRCRKRFFATWWYRNPFARKCVHCGLPKWASSDLTLRPPPQSN